MIPINGLGLRAVRGLGFVFLHLLALACKMAGAAFWVQGHALGSAGRLTVYPNPSTLNPK